eukprot:TRINITY_DN2965_c0_g1_i1.p1 TRINITY_DN2965_c0_g1~~TRINITY_DN2965_c0_g1_i1.p1  ORF type:complete len:150 (-),score=11.33 TRINITY_DN2965_c0_g1_i1:86-475(-)
MELHQQLLSSVQSIGLPGIVIAFALILLVASWLGASQGKSAKPKEASEPKVEVKTFTAEEVATHNKRTDAWIIIKDKVYDITPYVEEHPGGSSILNNVGGDSTEGFFGPQHPSRVFDQVDEYYVGDLAK